MVNVVLFVRTTKKSDSTKVGFRLIDGREVNVYYTSDILVNAKLWDQKRQTFKSNIKLISDEERTNTLNEITKTRELIIRAYNERSPKDKINSKWLKSEMDYLIKNPKRANVESEKSFFESFEDFIVAHRVSYHRKENYRVVLRSIIRFEKFKQKKDRKYKVSFKTLNSDQLREMEDYFRKEHQYYFDYPELYKDISEKHKPRKRGDNTISGIFTKLRTFVLWSMKRDKTIVDPFNDYTIIKEKYGTPFYLSQEERNKIYQYDFSDKPHLEVQRDIFIFQCMIGCRVGDLYKLTKKSVEIKLMEVDGKLIEDGTLEYVAGKTKDGDPKTLRIPLSNIGLAIYKKYSNVKSDKIFPFISEQRYNDYLKIIFKDAGIDRIVTVLNPTNKEIERKYLYEIASTHLARRTFVGNLYKQTGDQRLVSSMSGHKENSLAFGRYAEVDDDMKRKAITQIDL
jgi:site-specific recombinase XerD